MEPAGLDEGNDALNNIKQQGFLLGRDYGPFAQYFVKFIEAYGKRGADQRDHPAERADEPDYLPGAAAVRERRGPVHRVLPGAGARAAQLGVQIYGDDLGLSAGAPAPVTRRRRAHRRRGNLHGIAWHCYHGSPDSITTEHELFPRLDEIIDECSPG